MALPGWVSALLLAPPPTAEHVQPAGVDLSLDSIEEFEDAGMLGVEKRRVPPGRPLEPREGWWRLGRGVYRVRFAEAVSVPPDAVGLCFPRSSLLRMGVLLGCAVWDPGYRGRGQALLAVLNPRGVLLERGARVAQLVFIAMRGWGGLYDGGYQGEGLATSRSSSSTRV